MGKGQGKDAGCQNAAYVNDVFCQAKFQAGPVRDSLYNAITRTYHQTHIKGESRTCSDQYDCDHQDQDPSGKSLGDRNH